MALVEEKPQPADIRERIIAELGDNLELRADGVVRTKGQATTAARPDDAPPRTDLPKSHPLYGKRVVRVVLSGMSDQVIDADGRLTGAAAKDQQPVETEVTSVTR